MISSYFKNESDDASSIKPTLIRTASQALEHENNQLQKSESSVSTDCDDNSYFHRLSQHQIYKVGYLDTDQMPPILMEIDPSQAASVHRDDCLQKERTRARLSLHKLLPSNGKSDNESVTEESIQYDNSPSGVRNDGL